MKRFPVRDGRVLTAVNDVSFAIDRGEAVGLVGESGSGKTTVGRCVLRLIEPTSGTLRFNGQEVASSRQASACGSCARKLQMVFQDPFDSLDPRQSLSAAIEEPLSLTTDMARGERKARVADLLRLVGLQQDAAVLYPHQVSAGELQRVGIARAIATQPDLVVFDEPTSALDVSVRADILNLLRDLQQRLGMSYLFISHDLTAVRRLCHRTAIMYLGKLVEVGETEELFRAPIHPYSRALLSSVLYPDPAQRRSPFLLSGEIPSPIDLPSGCALHTRCPMATADCARIEPALEEKAPGRTALLHQRGPMATSNGHRHTGSGAEHQPERKMSDEDVVWMGAAELGRRIAAGEVTSRQATIAYLDRIAALNPALEAYVTVTADRALTEAAARDAELARGHRRGPLHGVPYCLKDVIATGGIRTTAGSIILADWVPDTDATVVTRLGAAGAVLLGKVNTHEFAFGVSTQNTHARTRNPWDPERIAGGSSGGSGAALAAGLAAFSIGTDTAGSIRLPSAFCGVAGIKPTFGLVSTAGVVAQSYTSDHVGPIGAHDRGPGHRAGRRCRSRSG